MARPPAARIAEPTLNPFALDAPELIQLIANKEPRAIGNWRELGGEEYGRSFTAAQTMGYDIVRDLHDGLLATFQEDGGTEREFVDRMLPILREKGWLADQTTGQQARRLLLIYDTNLRTGQAVGRWARIQATKTALPYLYGFTAHDERVRHPPQDDLHDHRAFEGILLPVDHPFWQSYFPPLGFRCRCQVVQKSRSQAARLGQVTSEGELAARMKRLGPPFGFNPGRNSLAGVQVAAGRANSKRLEGAQPVDPITAAAQAKAAWDKAQAGQSAKAKQGFREVVRRDVNAETIKVEPRGTVVRRLNKELAAAAAHPDYEEAQSFNGRNPGQWGKAAFNSNFDDKTVSMLAALKPELDDLADQIGVPRIRGFVSLAKNGRANADQGDGVMGINPVTFGQRAARIGTDAPVPTAEGYAAARAKIKAELEPLTAQLDQVLKEFDDLRARYPQVATIRDRPGATEVLARRAQLLDQIEALQAKDFLLGREARQLRPVSTWLPGDGAKTRPWSMADYQLEGVDKARSTLIHEFGHHVHQYLNKAKGVSRWAVAPPLERELKVMFEDYKRTRLHRSASEYSEHNEKEWFVENFSAYVMGNRSRVDPELEKLIERIFRREFVDDSASLARARELDELRAFNKARGL